MDRRLPPDDIKIVTIHRNSWLDLVSGLTFRAYLKNLSLLFEGVLIF